ncbi:MAG: ABC transporter permease [Dehalococcoidia bacterium]
MVTDAGRTELPLIASPQDAGARRRGAQVSRFMRTQPLGTISLVVLILFILVALFASRIATHDPYALGAKATFQAPGAAHLMGTDNYGRDIFSRVVYGTRTSISIGFTTVLLASLLAAAVGAISGYLGGTVDLLVQRIVDAFQAFPALILAIIVVSVLKASAVNVVIALTLASWPGSARVIRAQVLSLKESQFIDAARSVGAPDSRIVLRHVFPNILPIVLVLASASVASVIVAEATLSFLGLGIPPPQPSWGSILTGAQQYAQRAPWIGIFPGLAITIAVFTANFLGDSIRDVLDPRLRH